jgi:hypothetical protein
MKRETHTKADKLRPVPVTEFIIHRVAPIAWTLVFRGSSPLKTEPGSLRALHIAPSNTRLIVEGEIDPTLLPVCSQMKLRDKASNDLIIQTLSIFKGKVFKAFPKVTTPLAHDIIRGNLLRLNVVGGASCDNIISVGVPI